MLYHLSKVFAVHRAGYSRQGESDVSLCKISVKCLELRWNCRREIERNVKAGGDYACKLPELPVNAPEIMRFIKSVPDIDCSEAGIDWVACQVDMFRIKLNNVNKLFYLRVITVAFKGKPL